MSSRRDLDCGEHVTFHTHTHTHSLTVGTQRQSHCDGTALDEAGYELLEIDHTSVEIEV